MEISRPRGTLQRLTPWFLLLPVLILMLGVFTNSLLHFLKYSTYGFTAGRIIQEFTVTNYVRFFSDPYYLRVMGNTFKLSLYATGLALLVSYPVAYTILKIKTPFLKQAVTLIVFMPLLVSVVVRTYGWMVLLSGSGVVNWLLMTLGLISEPLRLLYNQTGVLISLVHIFLPFMVFPIMSVLQQMEPALKEAAQDLRASRLKTFTRITLPLSLPGIVAGVQLVFTMCLTAFVTPALLGGGRVIVLSGIIYYDTIAMNWPMATTAGAVLLLMALLTVMAFNKLMEVLGGL